MNGNRYLLDTNAVVFVVEFLSFAAIMEKDQQLLFYFIKELEVVNLKAKNAALLGILSRIRSTTSLKPTDAIIAATALHQNAILITNNKGCSKYPN